MRRPTILLADDHAMVREELVRLLTEEGFDVVAVVDDGHLLRDAALRLRPDVIVTDLAMPGPSVFDMLAGMKHDGLASKVIILTMSADADLARQAIDAGASGYLLKNEAGRDLGEAIRRVLQSGVYLTATLRRGS